MFDIIIDELYRILMEDAWILEEMWLPSEFNSGIDYSVIDGLFSKIMVRKIMVVEEEHGITSSCPTYGNQTYRNNYSSQGRPYAREHVCRTPVKFSLPL